jgi:formamidopyrimidine-DNA glycosylase
VKLKTEWLHRRLAGRTVLDCQAAKPSVQAFPDVLRDRRVCEAFCKGKHIFIAFEGDVTIHNHLLMRGRWRKEDGRLLFLHPGDWLSLYVGPYTVVNSGGQMLRRESPDEVAASLARLGPDAMTVPYPAEAVSERLRESDLPIAEALLDQSLVCGLGNTARSEALFEAGIDPRLPASDLSPVQCDRLHEAVQHVLWESFRRGGRWTCHVYRRDRRPCTVCGVRVVRSRLEPSGRSIYFCPRCQTDGAAAGP